MNRIVPFALITFLSIHVSAQEDEYYVDFPEWETFASEVYNAYKKEHLTYCGEELVEFDQLDGSYGYYALDNKSFKIEKSQYDRIENRIRKFVKGESLVWGTTDPDFQVSFSITAEGSKPYNNFIWIPGSGKDCGSINWKLNVHLGDRILGSADCLYSSIRPGYNVPIITLSEKEIKAILVKENILKTKK